MSVRKTLDGMSFEDEFVQPDDIKPGDWVLGWNMENANGINYGNNGKCIANDGEIHLAQFKHTGWFNSYDDCSPRRFCIGDCLWVNHIQKFEGVLPKHLQGDPG